MRHKNIIPSLIDTFKNIYFLYGKYFTTKTALNNGQNLYRTRLG